MRGGGGGEGRGVGRGMGARVSEFFLQRIQIKKITFCFLGGGAEGDAGVSELKRAPASKRAK